MSGPNLWQKVGETAPGAMAHKISTVLYYNCSLSERYRKALTEARDYLEGLAFAELKAQVPPWVEQLSRETGKRESKEA